jgi:hypothetical protein
LIGDWAAELSKGFVKKGRRYRGLKLFERDEMRLFEALSSGDFFVSGFTNGDLSEKMYGTTSDCGERLRRSQRIAYRLRLLRAHGLVHKVPNRNRYKVSARGREALTALLQLQKTNLQLLNAMPI